MHIINHLTTAQINGTSGKLLTPYTHPHELGYLPIDKHRTGLFFQEFAIR